MPHTKLTEHLYAWLLKGPSAGPVPLCHSVSAPHPIPLTVRPFLTVDYKIASLSMSVRKKLAPCCWSAVCSSWTKLLEIRPLTPHHHQAPGCEWTWLEVDWKGASRIVTNYHVNLKYSDMENWHLKTSVPFVLLEIWGNELGRFSFFNSRDAGNSSFLSLWLRVIPS